MITDQGKYYLYRHIRLDNNQVFYIGIGTKHYIPKCKPFNTSEYKRAFDKKSRTKFWKDVVEKTDFKVEIILETNDYNFLQEKEIEFVSIYGRRCDKSGSLVNFEIGGKSSTGYKFSIERMSKHLNYVRSTNWVDRMKTFRKPMNKIIQLSKDGSVIKEWDNIKEIEKVFNRRMDDIYTVIHGKRKTAYGYKWQYKDK